MRLDNFKLFAAAAILALCVLVAGCGGDDVKPASGGDDVATVDNTDESESAAAEADTDLPSDEDLETYFNAVSAYDIEELKSAMSLPGGTASFRSSATTS